MPTALTSEDTCRTPNCDRPVFVQKRQLCGACYHRSRERGWAEPDADGVYAPIPRRCRHCGDSFDPTHSRQSWCLVCSPTKPSIHLRWYDVTPAELQRIWDEQGGRCRICAR